MYIINIRYQCTTSLETSDSDQKASSINMGIHDGVFADPASLSQAKAVGQGFNVYGSFDASSLTRPLEIGRAHV